MRLLIITQKVDKTASDLSFFHAWIKEFSKNFDQVIVVCLQKGYFDLPTNVRVLSLGKEEGIGKFGYIRNFYKIIWSERKNYDAVFVHMNQIYVILGGLLWHLLHKPIFLWYLHKNVSTSLRVAEKLVTNVFTASKESFRLKSRKVKIVGHGIDTELFKSVSKSHDEVVRLVTVGRISPAKNINLMIDAVSEITKLGKEVYLTIIGDPGTSGQIGYLRELEEKVREEGLGEVVKFIPGVPNEELPALLAEKDIFLNFSNTGSIDKAVLEAYFAGLRVVTTNEAFKSLNPLIFYLDSFDPKELCGEIFRIQHIDIKESDSDKERMNSFKLNNLFKNISSYINE